jgi:hypothetical protein
MPFVAGKKTPVTAGMKTLKKMAEPQASYGEQWNGVGLKKTRNVTTPTKKL